MSNAEVERRALLPLLPLAAAWIGIAATSLSLGIDTLAQSHNIIESIRILATAPGPVLSFGILRVVAEHGDAAVQILATGAGATFIAALSMIPGARRSQ